MLTRERFGRNPVAVLERYRTLGASGHSLRSRFSCNERNLLTLQDYIWDPEFLRDGQPPNDRGCRSCGKIGHIVKDCPRKNDRRRKDSERERQAEASKGVAHTVKAVKAASAASADKRAATTVEPVAAAAAAGATASQPPKPATTPAAGKQPNVTPAAASISRTRLKRLVRNVQRDKDLLNAVTRYSATAVVNPKPGRGGGGGEGGAKGGGQAKATRRAGKRRGKRGSERETQSAPKQGAEGGGGGGGGFGSAVKSKKSQKQKLQK